MELSLALDGNQVENPKLWPVLVEKIKNAPIVSAEIEVSQPWENL